MENDDFILFLNDVENIIQKYFHDNKLFLELVRDPESSEEQLIVYIQLNDSDDVSSTIDNLHKIDREVRPLKTDNIQSYFLINVE